MGVEIESCADGGQQVSWEELIQRLVQIFDADSVNVEEVEELLARYRCVPCQQWQHCQRRSLGDQQLTEFAHAIAAQPTGVGCKMKVQHRNITLCIRLCPCLARNCMLSRHLLTKFDLNFAQKKPQTFPSLVEIYQGNVVVGWVALAGHTC